MFRMREEQMQVFRQDVEAWFAERVVKYLRTHYPKYCEERGLEIIRQVIRDARDIARHFDLESEAGVILCAELVIAYGDEFYNGVAVDMDDTEDLTVDEPPFNKTATWAPYILNHEQLTAAQKIERLSPFVIKESEQKND